MKRLAAFAILALSACAPAPRGGAGEAGLPRIVSLNPCTDAILAEVAEPQQIVALSSYSHDPASSSMDVVLARRWPATSGAVEELVTLRPDVVVSGNFTPPATRAASPLHRPNQHPDALKLHPDGVGGVDPGVAVDCQDRAQTVCRARIVQREEVQQPPGGCRPWGASCCCRCC